MPENSGVIAAEVAEPTVSITFNPNRVSEAVLAPDKATVLMVAEAFIVDDDDSCAQALALAHDFNDRVNLIEGEFAPEKKLLYDAWQGLCAKIKRWCDPYRKAKTLLEDKAAAFRKGEKKLVAEAEVNSVATAAKHKEDLMKKSRLAKMQGKMTEARELEAAAGQVVAVVLADQKPEVAGVSEKEPWVPLENPNGVIELIQAVASGKFPLMHSIKKRGGGFEEVPILEVNEALLKYLARTQEQNFKVPGFTVDQDLKFAHKKGGR